MNLNFDNHLVTLISSIYIFLEKIHINKQYFNKVISHENIKKREIMIQDYHLKNFFHITWCLLVLPGTYNAHCKRETVGWVILVLPWNIARDQVLD